VTNGVPNSAMAAATKDFIEDMAFPQASLDWPER
jgi:hypothetical protein